MEAHERISQGIQDGINRHWRYTKNLFQIKPEYLLTISVADAITDGFSNIHGMDLTIKLEEPTKSICFNLMSNAVGLREYFKRERHKVSRRGKVDIFVEHERNCWIIELKGFDPSLTEIRKDLVRLAEFLSVNNWENKCQGAFLAFPTLIDQNQILERIIASHLGGTQTIMATVHTVEVNMHKNPEHGIPIYYTNCISINTGRAVGL
ncbi:hypothetical protein QT917_000750 [Xanthomonas campestris pv. campestris]|uniref:hypothetical protein n=1 Tax=Xanthomonas campestris TaxID=339 RepID=UPI0025A1D297|nr:hypothetical protein [Xanthomonas campestris]MDM7702387.1 hypothetical protein [Xanthomonas campestris pv. campestris]MEA0907767.1 hypothetical protein [Xanthomonas campestris pv. campestris]MEB1944857.1 hypothetical protein [Xanthomonas campestris pv. campestris]